MGDNLGGTQRAMQSGPILGLGKVFRKNPFFLLHFASDAVKDARLRMTDYLHTGFLRFIEQPIGP